MQSLKQRAARKHLYNQSCHYKTLEDSILKVLAPNAMCRRQFLFSNVCLTQQLHTTPSKENMSAVPRQQPTSLSLKLCHIYCKSSPIYQYLNTSQHYFLQIKLTDWLTDQPTDRLTDWLMLSVNHIVTMDKNTDLIFSLFYIISSQDILFANWKGYSSCILVLSLPTFVSCSFPHWSSRWPLNKGGL